MHRFLPASLLAAIVTFQAASAPAGTIGFRTDAEVRSGPGADAKITLTHTGDEPAEDVMVRVELDGRGVDGGTVPVIQPGGSHVWNLHIADELPRGVHVVVVRARYSDQNGYPFEVISTASATNATEPETRVFGNLDVPNLPAGGEVTLTLNAKKPPARKGDFEASLAVPSGLHVTPERVMLSFDAQGKASAAFRVRNKKLLAGTTVNLYGLVTGTGGGFPQTDTIRGTARIVSGGAQRSAPPPFYTLAAVVFGVLVLLEGYWWMTGRRRQQHA